MNKLFPLLSAVALATSGGVSTRGLKDDLIGGGHGDYSGSASFPHLSSASVSYSQIDLTSSGEQEIPSEYFSCPVYGPFHIGDPNFEATFQYRLDTTDRQIVERFRVFNRSGSVVSATSHSVITYQNNALRSATFVVPIREYLTKDGITLSFEIVDRLTYKPIRTYSTDLYPLSDGQVSYTYLKNSAYETNPIGFYGDGSEMKGITESFNFTAIGDYLDFDYYYKLVISSLSFSYSSKFTFDYSSVTLRFRDSENLFPYLTHNSSSYVLIPLNANIRMERVRLSYKNKFYVNRKTLQTSDTPRTGFTQSNDFYLPINGHRIINDSVFYLDFENVGKSQLTFSYPIVYLADRPLVGVSDNGAHYVSGGSN